MSPVPPDGPAKPASPVADGSKAGSFRGQAARPDWKERFRRVGITAIDVLIPPRCRLCRDPLGPTLDRDDYFCTTCAANLDSQRAMTYCPRCGESGNPLEFNDEACPQCRGVSLRVRGCVRLGPYEGVLGHLLQQFKYGGREELLAPLVDWMVDRLNTVPWRADLDIATHVPTTPFRLIRRPTYPPRLVTDSLAGRLNLPRGPLLWRVRGGPHQISLSAAARFESVRNAFRMRRGVRIVGANILLVDDVRTTGATLEECARVLYGAGAGSVRAAVLTVTSPPSFPGVPDRLPTSWSI